MPVRSEPSGTALDFNDPSGHYEVRRRRRSRWRFNWHLLRDHRRLGGRASRISIVSAHMWGRQHPRGVDLPPGCNNTETLPFVNPDRSISCGPSRGHWAQPCPEAGSPRPRGPGPRLCGPTGEWRLAGGTPCGNGRAAGWFVHSGRLRAELGRSPGYRLLEIASARRPRPAARWWRRWHPHRTPWSDRPYDPGTTPYVFTGGTIKEAIIDVPSDRTATSSWRLGDAEA